MLPKQPVVNDSFWPGPVSQADARKLTFDTRASHAKVSYQVAWAKAAPGHKLKYDLYRRTSLQD